MVKSCLSWSSTILILFFLSIFSGTIQTTGGPLQDTCPTGKQQEAAAIFINGFPCKNPGAIMPSDFKSSELNHGGDTDNFLRSYTSIITAAEYPGLNTLGVSIARTDIEVDGMVLPHSHPRASEMMYISKGIVVLGFIDTKNRMFQRTLREGDVFVFPRGLLHFSFNAGFELATIFSVLNGQNPGVVNINEAMFGGQQEEGEEDAYVLERLIMSRLRRGILLPEYCNSSNASSCVHNMNVSV